MEEEEKKFISIPVLIVGLFFIACFIVAMVVICQYGHIYELEASKAYRECTGDTTGSCNAHVTAAWRADLLRLGSISHVVFGSILALSLLAMSIIFFITKKHKKTAIMSGISFVKVFFAIAIADLALMFTIGMSVSFTYQRESVAEYLIYTCDALLVVNFFIFLMDAILSTKAKKSLIFFYVNKRTIVFEWVFTALLLGFSALLIVTIVASYEPFAFALYQVFVVPFVVIFEITIVILKIINYKLEKEYSYKTYESTDEY